MASPAFQVGDTAPDYRIYIGFWTNWSHGAVMGRTLTLSRQNADLVIAFTGVFVTFVGARFWRILCFICHRALSSSEPQGAFYHQRQVVLRNSSSADSAFVTFAGLCWAWRRSAGRAFGFRHLYLLFMLSVACTASFIVAGGFSSRMSNMAGSEVLLDGSSCAWLQVAHAIDYDADIAWQAWVARTVSEAFNYAQQCYVSPSSSTKTAAPGTSCSVFVRPQLSGERDPSAMCPFAPELCALGQTGNLRLDSGYLDSHNDLGMNSPKSERILMRSVLHCAPLVVDGNSDAMTVDNATAYTAYRYGNATVFDASDHYWLLNYSYVVPDLATQYALNTSGNWNGGADYRLTAYTASTQNGITNPWNSHFIPSPSLARSDADVFLMFLSGQGVKFMASTEDPWFRATTPSGIFLDGGVNGSSAAFTPDNAASPLACASQFQFCQSTPDQCGPLASFYDAVVGAAPAFGVTEDEFLTSNMTAQIPGRFALLANALNNFPLQFVTYGSSIGSSSLLARQSLDGGFQAPIPDTQWQTEMTNWWAAELAGLQTVFVQTAAGLNVSGLEDYRMPPAAWFESDMCANQKILSTAYGSFSVFGLLFIYIVGLFLIGVSLALEPCLRWWHDRRSHRLLSSVEKMDSDTYKDIEWTVNNTMQLQRLAYESAGVGEWTRCNQDIPVTVDVDTKLCALDLDARDHPRLCLGRKPLEKTFTGETLREQSDGRSGEMAAACVKPSQTPTSDALSAHEMAHDPTTQEMPQAGLSSHRVVLPPNQRERWQPQPGPGTGRDADSVSLTAISPVSTLPVPHFEGVDPGDDSHQGSLPDLTITAREF